MTTSITSLHHVTATVGDAQEDLEFYTKLLGLRLIKRTVNFDNTGVYHFYYGDARGTPGTIMTTFPYAAKGVRTGTKGAGQVTATSFSVPPGALDFWRARLPEHGVNVHDRGQRFGERVIAFSDPSGLDLELIESTHHRSIPWHSDGIDIPVALRGIRSVTLEVRDPGPTMELLQGVLGLVFDAREENRTRFRVGTEDASQAIDVLHVPDAPVGMNGIGTVHHVALAIGSEEEQRVLQEELRQLGYNVTDVRDRKYFRSIYFREKGGILIEIATEGPGFLVDEAERELGQGLKLPSWVEPQRSDIEAILPPIRV